MVAHLDSSVKLDIIDLYAKILPSGPHRLAWSRTQAFQAWYMGSNPVGGTGRALPHHERGFFDDYNFRQYVSQHCSIGWKNVGRGNCI